MGGEDQEISETAAEFTKAMTRLRARLRSETAPDEMPWTWSQLTTLARIATEGPTTTTALAQAEHVRRQSMAETLSALRDHGLIVTEQDPNDGRRILISASAEGHALTATIPAAREAWLVGAMRKTLRPDEQQLLRQAAQIMNKITDAEV